MKCLSVFLSVATEPQTMKVFNKKRAQRQAIFASAVPRGRQAMGSRHLPLGAMHFTGAMKRQRRLSTGQSNYPNSWLAALLSLARSPSPFSVSQSVPPLCASFTQTHNPPPLSPLPHTQSFHVIRRARMALQRASPSS